MIDKRISKSKKLACLKSDRSRVLYFMIYPHLDCDGRITGDPEEIREDCCPKLKYSFRKVAESIIDLANVGLLILYEDENERPLIEYTNFDCFQHGIRKDREAPSLIPSPQDVRTNSGVTPALYLRLNLSLKKEKRKEEIYFDFKERKYFNIRDEDMSGWKDAYPACDIGTELKKMREWLLANPEKKKKNYRRFIVNWLIRTQERGGTPKQQIQWKGENTVGQSQQRPTKEQEEFYRAREKKLDELNERYRPEFEQAKKDADMKAIGQIDNKIKEELAEWSKEYWENK